MTAVILSHIFVLGYGWFFVDALMVMLLAVTYLLLTRRYSPLGRTRKCGDGGCLTNTPRIVGRTYTRTGRVRQGRLHPRNQPLRYLLNQSLVRCQARSAAA